MIKYNIKDKFHITGMHFIYQSLKIHIIRFIAWVYLLKVHSMISVIVQPGTVFYNRRNPYGTKTKSFNIIKFFYKPLKISSPGRIVCRSLLIFIPAVNIIIRIPIIESCSHCKINCFFSKIKRSIFLNSYIFYCRSSNPIIIRNCK